MALDKDQTELLNCCHIHIQWEKSMNILYYFQNTSSIFILTDIYIWGNTVRCVLLFIQIVLDFPNTLWISIVICTYSTHKWIMPVRVISYLMYGIMCVCYISVTAGNNHLSPKYIHAYVYVRSHTYLSTIPRGLSRVVYIEFLHIYNVSSH